MKHTLITTPDGVIDISINITDSATCHGMQCSSCGIWWCIPHEGPWDLDTLLAEECDPRLLDWEDEYL